jgi:hypothetical protein
MFLFDSVFFLNAKILLLLRRGGLSLSLCTWFKTEHIFLETIRAVSITPAVARIPPKSVSQFPTFITTVLFLYAANQKNFKQFLSDLFIL